MSHSSRSLRAMYPRRPVRERDRKSRSRDVSLTASERASEVARARSRERWIYAHLDLRSRRVCTRSYFKILMEGVAEIAGALIASDGDNF